jgi:hypothetical protein
LSDPAAHAVVVAAVITGAVALAAIVGTAVTTWLTLRHQRKADDKRRQHERHMRLLESGLRAAVDFLAAADRTTRARQALDTAYLSLDNAKSSSDQQIYQRFLTEVEEARERASAAVADAENAYAAIRMLVPSVTDQARFYLDFCIKADAHPDEGKVDRQRARQMVEETIRRALGGDLPDDWMFTEPESRRPRWWKISLPRRGKRHAIAETPRQP